MTMLRAHFTRYRWMLDYGIAIATPLLALQLTLWLSSLIDALGQGFGKFSLFYLAILISSLRRRFAGVIALLLSILLIHEVIFPTTQQLSWTSLQSLVPLGLFLSVAVSLILLIDAVQSSKRQVERLNQQIQADSRDRLSMALSAAQMGMWDWDLVTGDIVWSPEHEQLLGLPPGRFDGRYETFKACVHPDDLEPLNQAIAQAIGQHLPYHHEYRVIWADGSIHWVEGRGRVLNDATGTPIRMTGTIMAIDQRKQAELTLQHLNAELEARVRDRTAELTQINDHLQETIAMQDRTQRQLWEHAQLLDLAHDTIMTLDLDGVIIFWNQGAERLYGWSKAEAVGQTVTAFLHMDPEESLMQIHAELLAQGYWEGELEQRDRHHHRLIVASRWVLQRDDQGKPLKILKINHDITARKQAERELQRYTAEVEDLYNNAPCGYHSLDTDGMIVRINDTELQWLGYAREDIIGKKKFTDLITPASHQVFYENFPRFKQQGWISDLEFEMIQADGSTRWVSVNATAIRDEAGQMIMSRSTLFDISDRRKADQMKQEFISIVSHELRTPLTSIRGSLGLLAGGVFDKKPERKQEMIEIASRQSDRLVRLVNDILSLRRLESGQTQLRCADCSMTDLMQQSIDTMRSQAEQQSVHITLIPTEVKVWADADAIVQTLTNLLSNAIKFSPAETTITLAATPDPVEPGMVRCMVQDQGRGIPAEQLEQIFGQFQQVDASDSRDKGGTGLGLAICRTIIEQHKGRIWAESGSAEQLDAQGSCFYFTLPIAGES